MLTQVDRRTVEQPVHVLGLAAVAAEQTVLAENPQVAGLGDRLVGRLRHLVGVAEPFRDARIEQPGQFVGVEAQQPQVEVRGLQVGQFERQQLEVPLGERGRLVVGDPVGLDLLGRQVRGDVDRDLAQDQEAGRPSSGCGRR